MLLEQRDAGGKAAASFLRVIGQAADAEPEAHPGIPGACLIRDSGKPSLQCGQPPLCGDNRSVRRDRPAKFIPGVCFNQQIDRIIDLIFRNRNLRGVQSRFVQQIVFEQSMGLIAQKITKQRVELVAVAPPGCKAILRMQVIEQFARVSYAGQCGHAFRRHRF